MDLECSHDYITVDLTSMKMTSIHTDQIPSQRQRYLGIFTPLYCVKSRMTLQTNRYKKKPLKVSNSYSALNNLSINIQAQIPLYRGKHQERSHQMKHFDTELSSWFIVQLLDEDQNIEAEMLWGIIETKFIIGLYVGR